MYVLVEFFVEMRKSYCFSAPRVSCTSRPSAIHAAAACSDQTAKSVTLFSNDLAKRCSRFWPDSGRVLKINLQFVGFRQSRKFPCILSNLWPLLMCDAIFC